MALQIGLCTLCSHFFEHFSEAKALIKHYSSILVAFFPEKINVFRENKNKNNFSWKIVFSWKTKTNSKKLEIQSAETGENIIED